MASAICQVMARTVPAAPGGVGEPPCTGPRGRRAALGEEGADDALALDNPGHTQQARKERRGLLGDGYPEAGR